MASALVIIAEGTEEIEAITPADVLARCGVSVTMASVGAAMPEGRNGLPLRGSVTVRELRHQSARFDAVVIPGGAAGSANIAADLDARSLILEHAERGAVIAAICAAPVLVLAGLGLVEGRRVTCYAGMEHQLPETAEAVSDDVVVDGRLITGRGPASAMAFGLAIGAAVAGADASRRAAGELLVR